MHIYFRNFNTKMHGTIHRKRPQGHNTGLCGTTKKYPAPGYLMTTYMDFAARFTGQNFVILPRPQGKKMYQSEWGLFPWHWCNVIIYHHIYIYMIDFFCDFGVFRVKISLSLFDTDFCIMLLRYCTQNFESFGAKLK